ncbi:coiled-coil domain-containing protein 50 isoform X2 [Polypterus senegalus]|uniref:coiled-coil domain-containing protein 50 isoform X2 n=1 Tax=Polypterus senegalus TaxID=55291 RepID=UPI00196663AD|nr:coiled-coil domain-containing protein 50 isoform X2 [Polypterus senegalus]
MADISIDQKKLPGVKEVCRDFAVLEDHTLAHNLQEQEIETHLASNIQKNRLVQHDLKVAKKLQEEEDMKARVRHQQRHKAMERSDKEIAHEIQEQLVKQAEQIRKQEETDEVIARKLQEQELKEERRRKKVPHEVPHEDMYYKENGGRKFHGDYSTQDMVECVARLDLRERGLTDLEVARRMQEEELQASEMDRRAAQVAQDEEIARLLMEEEKKSFKRSKERERGSMEKRRQDPHWKPGPEDVVRPRTHNTHETHQSRNDRPIRPPQPVNSYENISSGYDYPRSPCSSRPISRSEAPYKGSYYRE